MSGRSIPFNFPCGQTRRQFLWQAGNGFFGTAMAWMPDVIAETPEIIHVEVPQDGWGQMGELSPRQEQ